MGYPHEDGKDYLPPLPDEKPPMIFGYLPTVNLRPVIVDFSHILRWMWVHWGEGGGGQPQPETVEFDLREYFGVESLMEEMDAESTNIELMKAVTSAFQAGKKVYLLDRAASTDLGAPQFKYEVELIHIPAEGEEGRIHFTARGQVVIGGEIGAVIPRLCCQIMPASGDDPEKLIAMVSI